MTLAAIPSPSTAVWHLPIPGLGSVPIRAYALCIILGIVIACVVTEARLRRRGAMPFAVLDVAVWAVPFGIVGARIYHVITSPQGYFGAGGDPVEALKIWQGGLGIWGAVAGGAVGAWIGCRQLGIPLGLFADALAPGLPLAQAVGRFGNWFNNELYGGPTTLPWGLEVHRMDRDDPGQAMLNPDGTPELLPGLYHPTFAYEALWNVGVAALVLVLDRRLRFGRGRAFALYVMGYTAGRFWIEIMRSDPANEILGARVNVWVSILVFLGAVAYFLMKRGSRQFLIPVSPVAPVTRDSVAAVAEKGSAGRHRVVTEEEFLAYQRGDGSPDGTTPTRLGPMDDDEDDGADLVDASMPPLDDFADDVTDDEDDPDDIDELDDEGDRPGVDSEPAARSGRSTDER